MREGSPPLDLMMAPVCIPLSFRNHEYFLLFNHYAITSYRLGLGELLCQLLVPTKHPGAQVRL